MYGRHLSGRWLQPLADDAPRTTPLEVWQRLRHEWFFAMMGVRDNHLSMLASNEIEYAMQRLAAIKACEREKDGARDHVPAVVILRAPCSKHALLRKEVNMQTAVATYPPASCCNRLLRWGGGMDRAMTRVASGASVITTRGLPSSTPPCPVGGAASTRKI